MNAKLFGSAPAGAAGNAHGVRVIYEEEVARCSETRRGRNGAHGGQVTIRRLPAVSDIKARLLARCSEKPWSGATGAPISTELR